MYVCMCVYVRDTILFFSRFHAVCLDDCVYILLSMFLLFFTNPFTIRRTTKSSRFFPQGSLLNFQHIFLFDTEFAPPFVYTLIMFKWNRVNIKCFSGCHAWRVQREQYVSHRGRFSLCIRSWDGPNGIPSLELTYSCTSPSFYRKSRLRTDSTEVYQTKSASIYFHWSTYRQKSSQFLGGENVRSVKFRTGFEVYGGIRYDRTGRTRANQTWYGRSARLRNQSLRRVVETYANFTLKNLQDNLTLLAHRFRLSKFGVDGDDPITNFYTFRQSKKDF